MLTRINLDIRLAGYGANEYQGRLEILFRGEWGTICQDNFQYKDAQVACKMLGLGAAIGFVNQHRWPNFGPGDWDSKIWLDSLICTGEESSLFDCLHHGVGGGECNHNRDVGVVCERKKLQININKSYHLTKQMFKPYQYEIMGAFMMRFRALLRC